MIRLVIHGILGRMGTEICRTVLKSDSLVLVGGTDTLETYHADQIFVSTDPEEVLDDAEVVVDFSSGAGSAIIAEVCRKHNIPLITGTTGLTEAQQEAIESLSQSVPVVQSFNFSVGINLMVYLLKKATEVLEDGFDNEIVEVHHRNKKDAPSGTALLLANALADKRNLPRDVIQLGRGGTDLRRESEITIHSLRGGSVIGEHQAHFYCGHENISINHQALSRSIYVDGVMRSIRWLGERKPGLYSMADVLDLH